MPRQETVTSVSATGYAHETEDSDEHFGGQLEGTDFASGRSVPLGYDTGNAAFAESGVGGRWLYVQHGIGTHYLRDLATGTEKPLDMPRDASYRGLLGDGCADLTARDTAGRLYAYGSTCRGAYGSRVLLGSGWNAFKSLF
ncbi:hypothetical protein [Streptomyces sp. NPDC002185]|uniref:hypothetical protein n=1 Tax=Streptomyces sp. NPDC002185 TaxID=3364636 RepID=UPI0036882FAB